MLQRSRVVKDDSQTWNVLIDVLPGDDFSSSGFNVSRVSPGDQNINPNSIGYPKQGTVCHGSQSISKVISHSMRDEFYP